MDKFKQDNLLEPEPIDLLIFELVDKVDKLALALQHERAKRQTLQLELQVLRGVVERLQAVQTELGYFAPQPVRRAAWWQFWNR